jgi:ActR/RegA family two-component response regulator
MSRRALLVIEDGHEYEEFARTFLGDRFSIAAAHSAREALACVAAEMPDALLVDLRFERAPVGDLVGDVDATARRRFAGDTHRAIRHLKEQQGTLVLGELRAAGCDAPAVFVHDFPQRRLQNLRRLYGRVEAVPAFDAAAIAEALGVGGQAPTP